MLFEWFSRTKIPQNYTLIGCLAETGQDQHLKLSPQSYILFWKVFFLTETVIPPGKYPRQELFKSPHFSEAPFSKFGTESCPPSRKGGRDTVLSQIYAKNLFNLGVIFYFKMNFGSIKRTFWLHLEQFWQQ